jgi:hypothetical protein
MLMFFKSHHYLFLAPYISYFHDKIENISSCGKLEIRALKMAHVSNAGDTTNYITTS